MNATEKEQCDKGFSTTLFRVSVRFVCNGIQSARFITQVERKRSVVAQKNDCTSHNDTTAHTQRIHSRTKFHQIVKGETTSPLLIVKLLPDSSEKKQNHRP